VGKLRNLKSLKPLKEASIKVFDADPVDVWENAEELTPEVFTELEEKYGDRPEWMRITGYREGRHERTHRRRSELLLNLRGKNYWFPLAPKVYERFIGKIINENRGVGLRYLQKYIRQYRTYKERWPSKRYVRQQRLSKGSFLPESQIQPSQVGLPEDVIEAILTASEQGMSVTDIAHGIGISRNHVESVLGLHALTQHSITDGLLRALADGDLTVEAAISDVANAAERHRSKTTLSKLRSGSPERMKSIRFPGMKRRSRSMKVTPTSI
jgi:hypothetical protein